MYLIDKYKIGDIVEYVDESYVGNMYLFELNKRYEIVSNAGRRSTPYNSHEKRYTLRKIGKFFNAGDISISYLNVFFEIVKNPDDSEADYERAMAIV